MHDITPFSQQRNEKNCHKKKTFHGCLQGWSCFERAPSPPPRTRQRDVAVAGAEHLPRIALPLRRQGVLVLKLKMLKEAHLKAQT